LRDGRENNQQDVTATMPDADVAKGHDFGRDAGDDVAPNVDAQPGNASGTDGKRGSRAQKSASSLRIKWKNGCRAR
jgi:hypothetical protein